ncbi:MAG: ABC transporter permease [Actinobacteria bacterium]|nr:ABC transporter permease [Actinomycetota bacterium]
MTARTPAAAPGLFRRVRSSMSDPEGGWIGLVITPVMALILLGTMLWVWNTADIDQTTRNILEGSKLRGQFQEHLFMAAWSTVFVIGIAVPLGILLTRPRFKRFATPVLTFASSGQAIPAYGLLILFFTWIGTGPWTSIYAFTLYAILPVLRNTIVGLEQVDDAVIEAGRGMGMTKLEALRKIELPLSVPVILAGIRTALVINIGMAALAVFIGGGGLGETINSGLKLRRDVATFMGAGIVAMLALVVDWLAALAERYLRPRGV